MCEIFVYECLCAFLHACRVMLCPFMLGWLARVQSSGPYWQGINCCVLCKGCEYFCMKWNMPISHFFHSVSQCAARKIIYTLQAEWTTSAWMLQALFYVYFFTSYQTRNFRLTLKLSAALYLKYEGFLQAHTFSFSKVQCLCGPRISGFIYFPYSSPRPLASPCAISSVYEPTVLSVHNDSCIQRL